MTSQTVVNDPFDSAENPSVRQPAYWGKVELDMFFAVLEKGVGKVPFDAQQHSLDKRVTAIDIKVFPIVEQNVTFDVSRGMIAESKEWAGTVLPSIKALGLTVRDLNGKWVKVEQVPTGSTYINKNGDTKDRTTFKFTKLFKDENEATADYLAGGGSAAPTDTQYQQPVTQVKPDGSPVDNKQRETALKFLAVVVENQARGKTDLAAIQAAVGVAIAGMPLVNKFFTADSPETLNLIAEKMAK